MFTVVFLDFLHINSEFQARIVKIFLYCSILTKKTNFMKKQLLMFVGIILVAQLGFSGGLVHNTNQSTAWTRMLVRDASTGIDAVFFNPAGLTKLNDGFHFSLNNQSLFQTQTITSSYPYLSPSPKTYDGSVSAPVFPGVYAAWKKGKLAISFGVNPIGGGGGATFDKGLPSMEAPFASLVPALGQLGVTAYNMDMKFEGTSVYWGIQLGATYEINEMISVYLGGRYVMAKNTYNGYIKDVSVTTPGGESAPGTYVEGIADQAYEGAQLTAAASTAANGGGDAMEPIIVNGGGDYTFAQLEGAGAITTAERAQMEGGLLALGSTQEEIDGMTAGVAQGTYYAYGTGYATASAEYAAQAQQLFGTAIYLTGVTADQEADVIQTGSGFTPIIGVNISAMEEKLNIGIKYEFHTKMDLTDEVIDGKGFIDGGTVNPATGIFEPTYMFNNGDVTNADIPAFLSIGASYEIIEPLTIQVGYHTYFDSKAGWATNDDGVSVIDKNFNEYAIGLEYNITEKFLVSAGYLLAITGANEFYQDDLGFSLTTNTLGGGFAYKINDKFTAQIGGFFTSYDEGTFNKTYDLGGTDVPYTETYDKETFAVSIGIDISL